MGDIPPIVKPMMSYIPWRDVSYRERNITPWSQLTKHRRRNYYMRFLMNTVTILSLRSKSVRRSTQR